MTPQKRNTNKPGKPTKPLDMDHENEITQQKADHRKLQSSIIN